MDLRSAGVQLALGFEPRVVLPTNSTEAQISLFFSVCLGIRSDAVTVAIHRDTACTNRSLLNRRLRNGLGMICNKKDDHEQYGYCGADCTYRCPSFRSQIHATILPDAGKTPEPGARVTATCRRIIQTNESPQVRSGKETLPHRFPANRRRACEVPSKNLNGGRPPDNASPDQLAE